MILELRSAKSRFHQNPGYALNVNSKIGDDVGMVGDTFERIKPLNNSNHEIYKEFYDFEC